MTAGRAHSVHQTDSVVAARLTASVEANGFPPEAAWRNALPARFDHDWQGKNADPKRETEVRVLWTSQLLYFRFVARYRSITVFDNAEPEGRRDHLWDRDVAEVFLQPAGMNGRYYKELEVSPNGFWIDLDIAPEEKQNLRSGLRRLVGVDEEKMIWDAQLALPMKCLTADFDPGKVWRVNFYRVEGAREPRFYSAWQPTGTPVPNFHVPESFGRLVFES